MATAETEIFQSAERLALEEKAAKLISAALTNLVLGRCIKGQHENRAASVFFATLILGMEPVPVWDPAIMTAATDGKRMYYNPEFVANLPLLQVAGVMAHEVMHPAMQHHERRGHRDMRGWNIGGDLAINVALRNAGFDLPPGALYPDNEPFKQWKFPLDGYAEDYYNRLPREKVGGIGPDGNDPGQCGGVLDGKDGDKGQYKVAVARAAQAAKQIGNLPSDIERMVGKLLNPKANWREILREFSNCLSHDDYSWNHPNRRFAHQGLYLPSRHSRNAAELFVSIDTSGSIGDDMLGQFIAELQAILDCSPRRVVVVWHHTHVYQSREFEADEALELGKPKTGGTSHVDVFKKAEQMDPPPACVIALTDLYTEFPTVPPPFPVLWAVSNNTQPSAPWGQIVELKD